MPPSGKSNKQFKDFEELRRYILKNYKKDHFYNIEMIGNMFYGRYVKFTEDRDSLIELAGQIIMNNAPEKLKSQLEHLIRYHNSERV